MNDQLRDLREFLEGKFERVDERFTTLETAILENRAEIRAIQDRLPAPGLDRRVTDLEHRVDALEERR